MSALVEWTDPKGVETLTLITGNWQQMSFKKISVCMTS
jgi:hypothetical protein